MTQIAPHKTVALTALVNHEPVTIAPDTPLGEVLEIMEQRKISCLLTVDDQRRPTGIFTEQDAVRLLVPVPGEHPPPQTMADVMHQPVFAMLSTIDQSFVAGMATDANDRAIATAVVAMAHSLGLEVLAEGVETPVQLDMLRALGCETVQGYLLGRPVPAGHIHPTAILMG